jgi:hypothetical protein
MGRFRSGALVGGLLLAACSAGSHSVVAGPSIQPGTSVSSTTTVVAAAPATTSTSSAPPSTARPAVTTTAPPSTVAPVTTTAAPVTAAPAPTTVSLSDQDSGRTVEVANGGTVTVVLHSTYWSFDPPSNGSVLQVSSAPTVAPAPPGQCVPGAGCGTVTVRYRAVGHGSAVIAANRTSCGEAMRCSPAQGTYRVTVVVP